MSSVADYVGRTVDLLAFQGMFPVTTKTELLAQSLVDAKSNSYIVTGIEKLVQKFLNTFLLSQGTDPYRQKRGTAFMPKVQKGFLRTVADVTQAFYSAVLDVSRQLASEALVADPLDEVFESATLQNVTLAADTIRLTILITSAAGTTYTFIAPIPVAIK